ncbi:MULTISPECIES: HTH-type transcriptional regulator MalT [unclassified Vibrio]|uniref:HTH-type transcriptional regulator MalT n=1 Tax=Vibrio sp. HB236076 TaxID=3232307 RepID=A0AB39HGN1_9VIBR|nr:HTH-type transcriptional regulator MalT [Vibrio sp. HB161653]MDP5252603.1 HTH-type transcriptional regulator MalT [Vibrio sp. HB161653]
MNESKGVKKSHGQLPWIRHKNQCATYPQEWPIRRRLDTLLHRHDRHYQCIFIEAPAGFGKTELMRHWYNTVDNKGWLTLDVDDSDPQRLIYHFLKACSLACQHPMTRCFDWLAQDNVEQALETALLILQDQPRRMYVFIDDIHEVASTDAFAMLSKWFKPLAYSITLILSSRQKMPFATAKRVLSKQDALITATQLALTEEEAQLSAPISATQADAYIAYTSGWPACFQLLCQSSEPITIDPQDLPSLDPDTKKGVLHSAIYQYVTEEVIAPLPLDLQSALLDLSLFDTVNNALLHAWPFETNIEHAVEQLTTRFHLLSRSRDGQLGMPAVLKGSLAQLRKQRFSQQQQALSHRQAVDTFLDLQDHSAALRHALASQELTILESILNQHGWQLLNSGQSVLVEQALNQLPYPHILAQPEITVLQAWVHQGHSQFGQVERCLLESEQYCTQNKINWSRSASGRYCALLAQIAMNRHQADKGKRLAKEALDNIPADDYRSQMLATSVLGESNLVQGHLLRALSLTQQSERLARRHQGHQQVLWSLIQQNEIYLAQGRTQHAYQHQERLFQFVQDYHLSNHSLHEMVIRLRVKLLWHWGRFDEAMSYCQQQPSNDGEHAASHDLYRQALMAMIMYADPIKKNCFIDWDSLSDTLTTGEYHPDWVAQASSALIYHWVERGNQHALVDWQKNHSLPNTFCNHFDQLQGRNHIRVLRFQAQFKQAIHLTHQLIDTCHHHQLNFDCQLNEILLAALYVDNGQKTKAREVLSQVLPKVQSSGIVTAFCLESSRLLELLNDWQDDGARHPWPKHHLQYLQKAMQQSQYSERNAETTLFAPAFVEQLLHRETDVPEFIRTSPLTPREWQVLGFIWLGLSNEEIACKMDVAYTTIKSHIRNLYQKLAISSRKQAKQKAQALMDLMH